MQWQFYLVPDYTSDKSAILLKFHHCFADGPGLVSTLCAISDDYDKKNMFEQTPNLSCGVKLMMWITLPFYILLMAFISLTLSKQRNPLKSGAPLDGVKIGALSKDLSLEAIKATAKKHGCTFNDVVMTCTSLSFKKYLVENGDSKTDYLNFSTPFTLRPLPNSPAEVEMENVFAPCPISCPLGTEFEPTMREIHDYVGNYRRSFKPFGLMMFFNVVGQFPTIVNYFTLMDLTSKLTSIYTNVAGPRDPLSFDGKKTDKMFVLLGGLNLLCSAFTIISHNGTVKVSYVNDTSNIKDPEHLIELFEEAYDKYVIRGEIEKKMV